MHVGRLADGSELTLSGPTERAVLVRSVDGGRLVVSGSTEGTVRVWDASTGAEVCRFDMRRRHARGRV